MKRISFLLILCVSVYSLFSQNEESRKDRIIDAEYLFLNEEYVKALQTYKQLATAEPENANFNFRTGQCYLRLPFENGRSIPFFRKAISNISAKYKEGSHKEVRAPLEALYWLGYALHINKYFDEALIYYKQYRDTIKVSDVYNIEMVDRQIESCNAARELLKNPVDAEIGNLGSIINSKSAEINPTISGDGKTILFTRFAMAKADSLNINRIYNKKSTIYESHLDSNGRWSTPVSINPQLKNNGTCQTLSLSYDGKTLLLFNDDWERGGPLKLKQGSIYFSTNKDGAWSPIAKLNNNINSYSWESHAFISPDGTELYFTSDRKGGMGGLDIYVSRMENGDWGPAINLGPTINTKYDEETPAVLQDGKTLYFSSEGHYNMGGFDVFYSKRIDSVNWSQPINVGYPINSPGDNLFYVPMKNGEKAIYSAARYDGYITFGNEDLYELDIITDPSQYPSLEITGRLRYEDYNDLDTSASIMVYDTNERMITKIKPNTSNGAFSCSLRPGDYVVSFSANEYKPEKRFLSLPGVRRPTPVALNVGLVPAVVREKKYYEIRNVYFDFNSSVLGRDALIMIEKLFVTMNENPGLYVEIVGHCDSRGSDLYNKNLSLARSRAVIDYLASRGIELNRFVQKGEGKKDLVAVDKTKTGKVNEEGARLNRRVEIKVLKSDNDMIVTVEDQIPDNLRFKKFNRYSIVVLEDPVLFDLNKFDVLKENLHLVSVLPTQTGYLYYGGDFKTPAQASKALNAIVKKGYNDARIVDYFYINKLNRFMMTNKVDWPRKYTIQLMAVSEQSENNFKGLSDVQELKTTDGFYRYIYKEFLDLDQAKAELQKIHEKGFDNAFVIDKSKLQ